MISADVPFRRDRIAFVQAFPEFEGPIVAVVEGSAPARVEQAATALAAALRADDEHFAAIDYPAGDPFFARAAFSTSMSSGSAALADRLAARRPCCHAGGGPQPQARRLRRARCRRARCEQRPAGQLDPLLGARHRG